MWSRVKISSQPFWAHEAMEFILFSSTMLFKTRTGTDRQMYMPVPNTTGCCRSTGGSEILACLGGLRRKHVNSYHKFGSLYMQLHTFAHYFCFVLFFTTLGYNVEIAERSWKPFLKALPRCLWKKRRLYNVCKYISWRSMCVKKLSTFDGHHFEVFYLNKKLTNISLGPILNWERLFKNENNYNHTKHVVLGICRIHSALHSLGIRSESIPLCSVTPNVWTDQPSLRKQVDRVTCSGIVRKGWHLIVQTKKNRIISAFNW